MKSQPYFSLVVATLDRTDQLDAFLNSMLTSELQDFEIIIVDQNHDQRLDNIIAQYASRLHIKYIKSALKNASDARNKGAEQAYGRWIGFPDDDCTYTTRTLINLKERIIDNRSTSVMLGTVTDYKGKPIMRYWRKKRIVNVNSIHILSESCLFIERESFLSIGGFDINFGPGGRFYAAEGCELLARVIKNKKRILFDASIQVFHENTFTKYDEPTIQKGIKYSYGFGCVIGKHFGSWSLLHLGMAVSKYPIKMLVFTDKNRRVFSTKILLGMFAGFFKTLGNA